MSWEDTALVKLIKERVFQFILTFLDEEHSLFSSGVGVILGVSYLTPALVKYRYWHAECVGIYWERCGIDKNCKSLIGTLW